MTATLLTIIQEPKQGSPLIRMETGEDLIMVVLFCVLLMGGAVLLALTAYLYLQAKELLQPVKQPVAVADRRTFWQSLTGLQPMKRESELLMTHDYDGIRELDNPTPPWFMLLFYGTIAFGFLYLLFYHVVGKGDVMQQEYAQEVAIATKQRDEYLKKVAGSVNENTVTVLQEANAIAAGKGLFGQYCTACHGLNAEGKVGPNLTDVFWLHGGSIRQVFHSIAEGIPDKGMVSWKKQLNPLQMQQVASYILSLQGSNPPNPKEPQGQKESNSQTVSIH